MTVPPEFDYGQCWYLCGPVFNMLTPTYWIASAVNAAVCMWVGYRIARLAPARAEATTK